jgi:hypothetical protein
MSPEFFGVRLGSGKEQKPVKVGEEQSGPKFLQVTQSASSCMKNSELLKSVQPLCQGSALTN